MNRILVVDDAAPIHALFSEFFPGPHYALAFAESARAARPAFVEHRPHVVVLDVRLPDGSGIDVFEELRALDATVPVLFITASSSSQTAIEATKRGAFDYLVKPLDAGQLRTLIGRALEAARLAKNPSPTGTAAEGGGGDADLLHGQCASMREVYKAIGRVASRNVTVLIRGETGTGKELVARVICQHSQRADRPFLAINCAAIPETLLESELFGHEKGAFTGADRLRIGKFEQCTGGTLFLDEIGEMPLALQSKILRVLQEQQVQRVGGDVALPIDVRVIAATNRDLEKAVAEGQFRADLYYRLNVYAIVLPPLRERPEDLPRLIDRLLGQLAQELSQPVCRLSADALAILSAYSWPGNVRELQSVLKQALLQAIGPIMLPEHLPKSVRTRAGPAQPATAAPQTPLDWEHFVAERLTAAEPNLYAHALERMERNLITAVLRHTLGNQTAAADVLGITRASLRHKIRALGIDVNHAARTGTNK